ncbi:site-specific DNA-methyltransferase [Mycoplasma procyoni]|uniref:site-specific DNA-methyltransferase n=1 Tax=Mycoplasma procyoni TaxID=568784 RepID=UPI00280C0D11|nr:site-specific DNA-methyltransferase [Mycoplasma procyoni]
MDPPYNTEATKNDGNSVANDTENISPNKFIYRDKYSRNGWLNLMNERLKLAKQLLKDDGVIFVSIDDSEQAYLKVLMDEIFGEENFVACAPRKTTSHIRKISDRELQILHDYLLIYSKNKNETIFTKEITGQKKYDFSDEKGNFLLKEFQNSGEEGKRKNRPNLYYPIYYNESEKTFSLEKSNNSLEILPNKVQNEDGRWLWSKEKFLKDNNLLFFHKQKIYRKEYFTNDESSLKFNNFKTWLDNFLNAEGSRLNSSINKESSFSYPKPLSLIKWLLSIISSKNIRVLDFFAGSGTAAHAVLELNREDGGNRTYTIVTNNENNIGEDVTFERLYRINAGKGTKGESFDWLKNNEPYNTNLNVFRINYYDVSVNSNEINSLELTNKLISLLKEFGIENIDSVNDSKYVDLLSKLLSLKPQK